MGLLSAIGNIGKAIFTVQDAIHLEPEPYAGPRYTGEDAEEYMDGFRTGYPLVGQPDYPAHESEPYQYGLKVGQKAFKKAGRPQIQ